MAKSRARKLADIIVGAGIDIDGNLTFDGGSTSADLTFADNDKANFGDASDLQIFHNGSHSFIKDAGTGDLYIGASNNLALMNSAFSENYLLGTTDGAVTLYYDGSSKLATTSTGVTVTGQLTASTNLIATTATYSPIVYGGSSNLQLKSNTAEMFAQFVNNGAAELYYDNSKKFETTSTGIQVTGNIDFPSSATILGGGTDTNMTIGTSSSGYQGLLKLQATGDIQLFQYGTSWTTNVTFKGDGQVGIGTTSPQSFVESSRFVVGSGTSGTNEMMFLYSGTNAFGAIGFADGTSGTERYRGIIGYHHDGDEMFFSTNGGGEADRDVTITSAGNVGIGTTSPGAPLHVYSDTEHQIKIESTASAGASMQLYSGGSYSYTVYQHPNANFRIGAYGGSSFIIRDQGNSADRLTIINNGNVGIGTTSPSYRFHTASADTNVALFESSSDSGTYIWISNSDAVTGRQANLGFAPANNIEGARISAVAVEDFSSSANRTAHLEFWTRLNGTMNKRMIIQSDGKVGIGTTSPAYTLDVNGTAQFSPGSSAALFQEYANGMALWLDGSDGDFIGGDYFGIHAYGTTSLDFSYGAATKFKMLSDGRVGINRTPSIANSKLEVGGADNVPLINVEASGNTGGLGIGSSGLQLFHGSSAKMYISSAGNVGIGTSSPTMPLSVQAASNAYAISMHGRSDGYSELYGASNDGSTKYSFLQSHSAQTKLYTLVNTPLLFGTNSTERMRITSGGNVGINCTNPATKFVVQHTDGASGIEFSMGASLNYLQSYNRSTSDYVALKIDAEDLRFGTNNGTERMRIDGSGNVGIGTASPGERLEVDGVIQIKRTGDHPAMRFSEVVSGSATTRAYMGSGDWAINGGDADDFGISGSGTGDLLLGTNAGAERMRIQNSTGNVGIGTTSPNAKLETRNSTTATDTIIASAGLATAGNYHELILGDSRNYAVGLRRYITQSNPSYLRPRLDFIVQDQDTYLPADREVRMSIKDNGNVGIGTTAPATKFHVSAGSTNANIIARLEQGTTPGNYSAVEVGRTGGNNVAEITAAVTGGVPISGTAGILLGSTNGARPAVGIQTPNSSNGHIVFNPKGSEKVRITADGDVGIGTTSPNSTLTVAGNIEITGGSNRLLLPNFWIGTVPNTSNNNNAAVLLVNLTTLNANNIGFQFSGSIIGNSYTGQAFVNVNIVKHYLNDNVAFDVGDDQNLNSTVSRMQLQLCTVTYNSNSYLAIVKNGGGTGTIFLNGYFQGWYPSQVTEVASGTYTVTTTHGNLNY